MERRYQIFVSSTYIDLQNERAAVLNAILHLNHLPAGMELFPSANKTPWELVKKVIDASDYYVLIIGGRYGSLTDDGLSFTEREYDYASSRGIHILPFFHGAPDELAAKKVDLNSELRDKLDFFRDKVERAHHRVDYRSAEDLAAKVVIGLVREIDESPAVGWVRANGIDNTKLLKRLASLQERYDRLLRKVRKKTGITYEQFLDSISEAEMNWFLQPHIAYTSVPDRPEPTDSTNSDVHFAWKFIDAGALNRNTHGRLSLTTHGNNVLDDLRKWKLLVLLHTSPDFRVLRSEVGQRLGISNEEATVVQDSLAYTGKIRIAQKSGGEYTFLTDHGKVQAARLKAQFEALAIR